MTGDYGEPTQTDLIYLPFVAKRYFSQGDLTLTLPFIDISTDGNAAVSTGDIITLTDSDKQDGSGLGDVLLKGRYYAVEQRDHWPFIDFVAKLKLPTADENKNLGTGETDLSLVSEFSRRINAEWFALAELGFSWIGDPPGADFNNWWIYSIGAGHAYSSNVTLEGFLDGRTALVDGNDDPLSALFSMEYKINPDLRIDSLAEIGLNDGAPDVGITIGIRQRI